MSLELSKYLLILCLAVISLPAIAQVNVNYGPPSAWVEKIDYNEGDLDSEDPYSYLLYDNQENSVKKEDYFNYSIHLLTTEGVETHSSITLNFDPAYEKLTIHKINIIRDGQIQERAIDGFRIIQREKDLQRSLYDGTLTAIKDLKDVREGDILEYSFTRKGYNPSYGKSRFGKFYHEFSSDIEKLYQTYWADAPLNIKKFNGAKDPVVTNSNGLTKYLWEEENVQAKFPVNTVPGYIDQWKFTQMSSMNSWEEVSDWGSKLYKVDGVVRNELRRELKKELSLENNEQNILAAIRLVQDGVRYLGFENGINAFKPHSPMEVLNNRYGDCKDKSLLLVSILQEMGLEANPLLVNTKTKHKVADLVPSPTVFDHCIVSFKLEDETFVIDPTQSFKGGDLSSNCSPHFRIGLPIIKGGSDFITINKSKTPRTMVKETLTVDTIGKGGAVYEIITSYNNSRADDMRAYVKRNSRASIKNNYENYYKDYYPGIKINNLEIIDTTRTNENNLIIKEKYTIDDIWIEDGEYLAIEIIPHLIMSNLSSEVHNSDELPYWLNFEQELYQDTKIIMSEDWSLNIDDVNVSNEHFDYRSSLNTTGNVIDLSYVFKIKKDEVTIDKVKDVLKDMDLVDDDLRFVVTYDKKYIGAETNDISIPALITIFFGFILGLWTLKWCYNYDPEPERNEPAQPFGGWLILPIIGLLLTPFRLIYDFIDFTKDSSYSQVVWGNILELGDSLFTNVLYAISIISGTLHVGWLMVFTFGLIYFLFKKRSNFPKLISFLYLSTFLMLAMDGTIAYMLDNNVLPFNKDVRNSLLSCCIWIPYFFVSLRVKETFVNRKA